MQMMVKKSERNEIVNEFIGPVIGGHTIQIHWKDYNGDVVINELRDIRVFGYSDNSFFIYSHAKLSSEAGLVVLDGDLQHAGVQFRASQFVAEHASSTKFIRPGH